jgi:hypothetical protein
MTSLWFLGQVEESQSMTFRLPSDDHHDPDMSPITAQQTLESVALWLSAGFSSKAIASWG